MRSSTIRIIDRGEIKEAAGQSSNFARAKHRVDVASFSPVNPFGTGNGEIMLNSCVNFNLNGEYK